MYALTPQQQDLVARNTGLVSPYIRKLARRLPHEIFRRERDDLYQEGLLGLMEAAARYQPRAGASFARYALPFIRGRVAAALLKLQGGLAASVTTVKRLVRRKAVAGAPQLPRFFSLEDAHGPLEAQALRRASRQCVEPQDPVLAGPLGTHELCQLAMRQAAARMKASRRHPDLPDSLVEAILEERLLVPGAHYKTPRRILVRRFGVSMYRVVRCEQELLRRARQHFTWSVGLSRPADDIICRELAAGLGTPARAPGAGFAASLESAAARP